MPWRNPDASSAVIAENLGWISSGLKWRVGRRSGGGGGGKKEKNTTTERSPPYAQRISCSAGFATAGEGGGRSGARGLARRRAGRGRAEEPSARRAPLPCGDSPALGMGMAAPPPISDNNSN